MSERGLVRKTEWVEGYDADDLSIFQKKNIYWPKVCCALINCRGII